MTNRLSSGEPEDLPELPAVAADFLEALDQRLQLPAHDRMEIQDELAAHLEDSIEALQAEGLDEESATREAVARLGRPEALAHDLEASRRSTRRLLAGAAGGVYQAGIGLAWGWFLGWLLVYAGFIVAAILVTTLLKPPIDFFAAHLPSIDTDSNDLAIGPAFSAAVVAFACWIAARRAVRTSYQISRRPSRAVRTVWAVAGGLALGWIVLFVYSSQQSWFTVAAELCIPAAFALGALKFEWAAGLRIPALGKGMVVAVMILLPVVLVAGLSVRGSGGSQMVSPVQFDDSAQKAALDRVAPNWGGDGAGLILGSDSGVIESRPTLDLTYAHMNGPSLSEFSDLRLEVWRAAGLAGTGTASQDWLVTPVPDPAYSAPFISRALVTAADGRLHVHLDLSKVRANHWLVFVTGTGSDGHRYRLNYPEPFGSTFSGTVWDWLTASS